MLPKLSEQKKAYQNGGRVFTTENLDNAVRSTQNKNQIGAKVNLPKISCSLSGAEQSKPSDEREKVHCTDQLIAAINIAEQIED